jgi:beta-phosphoglucomutase-like phosphatase (HAD superfamily)
MPCAIVTHLDSNQLDVVLRKTGLAEYFPPDLRVTSDSNYPSERSELLGAALRMEQRPDQCIVFDNTPNSAKVAHEISMKSVSLVNHYARYELLTADLSVGYVRDLDLRSLVKLFDKREDLEPLLELDVRGGLEKQQRKVKTA